MFADVDQGYITDQPPEGLTLATAIQTRGIIYSSVSKKIGLARLPSKPVFFFWDGSQL